MVFKDGDCILKPEKVALHVWDGAQWVEWTGAIIAGDIEIGAVEIKNAATDDRAIVTASGLLKTHPADDLTVARATGSAAVSMTVNPAVAFKFNEMRVHLSAAGTAGNLTVTLTSGVAAAYNTVIFTQDMTSVIDLVWQPTRPMPFTSGDQLVVAWANASTRTYGIEFLWTSQ